MREEMEFHRAARTADLIAGGMAPDEAARTARLEFGSEAAHHEECRAALGYQPWDELRSDIRFAFRGMLKSPGFTFAAIGILGLAIGVNAAFFTLYANYVLKPLPIPRAERHFSAETRNARGENVRGFTTAEFEALRQGSRSVVEDIYSAGTLQVLVTTPVQRHSMVTVVSDNYFGLLGGRPVRGRVLTEGDQGQPRAVLSQAGLRHFFPGEADAVGKALRVQKTIFSVVGVMPGEFSGLEPLMPDFWVPGSMASALRGDGEAIEPRGSILGFLAPNASLKQAETALALLASRFPRSNAERIDRLELKPYRSIIPESGELTAASLIVFAAFVMVLLIACANLANLYLSRAASRTHEIAMRLSLGASRWRIVRQLLTESTLMALLGATTGLLLAVLTVQKAYDYAVGLSGVAGLTMLPVSLDWRILLYSVALGIVAGLALGLLPALEITSPSLTQSTKREHSSFAGRVRPRRARNLLIGGQVATSLVLLIVGGILLRTIQRLDLIDPGYNLDRVFDLKLERSTPRLMTMLERQPQVAAVTAAMRVPLYGRLDQVPLRLGGVTTTARYNRVDQRYFEVLGLAVEGRGFTQPETSSRARVAVVSRATARKLWPGAAPVGQTFVLDEPGVAGTYQVIGVVPDVVSGWLFEGTDPTAVYFPGAAGQADMGSAMARITGNVAAVSQVLRAICAEGENGTGCEPTSLRTVSAMQRFPFQIAAGVSVALGGLALLLTAVGLYSVASYSVAQRRREIGIHIALGASPRQVLQRIVREAWYCVLGGVAVGLPICLALSKVAGSTVLQIRTFDPAAYLAVPSLLAVISLLACALPTQRAARLDPVVALREE